MIMVGLLYLLPSICDRINLLLLMMGHYSLTQGLIVVLLDALYILLFLTQTSILGYVNWLSSCKSLALHTRIRAGTWVVSGRICVRVNIKRVEYPPAWTRPVY